MSTQTPNLRDLTRNDLNAYAATCGVVEPHGFASKDELIAAVEAAQAGTTTSATTATPAEGETVVADEGETDDDA